MGAATEEQIIALEQVVERVADACEESGQFQLADWNDLGEVTVRLGDRTFRAMFVDITDEVA